MVKRFAFTLCVICQDFFRQSLQGVGMRAGRSCPTMVILQLIEQELGDLILLRFGDRSQPLDCLFHQPSHGATF